MRSLILAIALGFSTLTLTSCGSEVSQPKSAKDSVTIHVTLDKDLTHIDKWFFLAAREGNECYMLDSCFVAKGVDSFTLRSYFPFDSLTFAELVWDAGNVRLIRLDLMSTDYIWLHINNSMVHDIKGSPASEFIYKWKAIAVKDKEILDAQKDSVAALKLDADQYYAALQKLDSSFNRLKIERVKAQIPGRFTALDCLSAIRALDVLGAQQYEIDPFVEITKKRFPNDPRVIEFVASVELLKTGLQSDKGTIRYSKAKGTPSPRSTQSSQNAIDRISKCLDWDNKKPSNKPKIGDTISDFKLKALDGSKISLSTIKGDYIFIDLWAAWCAPCLKEIPFIKDALIKYSDKLTVVAISMDNNDRIWKMSVEEEQSQMFTHLYVGNTNKESMEFCDRFGIEGLPANFLIDKNRKVIAIDLRGKELDKKLSQLIRR